MNKGTKLMVSMIILVGCLLVDHLFGEPVFQAITSTGLGTVLWAGLIGGGITAYAIA